MCRKSLPLNALRAFEVAARHCSFTKAAEELSVSPAAVHHQIKGLSDQLGVELFERKGRGLALTRAGRACQETLEHGFDLLALSIERARAHSTIGLVKLSVCPSFAAKWLAPRLPSFYKAFPTIDIRLNVSTALVDFATDDADLAIHYGSGDHPGLAVETLGPDELVPVCSPSLLSAGQRRGDLRDTLKYRLIHDDSLAGDPEFPTWSDWLNRAGVASDSVSDGYHFETSSLAIDAAISGLGIALARRFLVARELGEGRLVEFSTIALPTQRSYQLVSLPAVAEQPKVAALREWIFSEISRPAAPKFAARPAKETGPARRPRETLVSAR